MAKATEATEQQTETETPVDYDKEIAALNLRIAESLSKEKLEQDANHQHYLDAKKHTRNRYSALRDEISDAVVKIEKEKREAAKPKK